jgi:hypothetical protein
MSRSRRAAMAALPTLAPVFPGTAALTVNPYFHGG